MTEFKKGFSISHVNVRSLTRNFNETSLIMGRFDIICISESWLHHKIPNSSVTLAGYSFFRQDRGHLQQSNKRGGGLIVYVKNTLSNYAYLIVPPCKVTPNLEQLWIEITKPYYKRQVICVIYRPPSGNLTEFSQELCQSIDLIDCGSSSSELTLIGDFNVNYKKTTSPEYKVVKEMERKYQLKQYIVDPTRVTNTVKSVIDLILTNMTMVSESGVMDSLIADHYPIYIVKKKLRNDKRYTYAYGRSYKNYNKEVFQNMISGNMAWRSFWVRTNDSNCLWDIMLFIITQAADCICPIKQIRIRENVPGWINKEAIEAIGTKKELLKQSLWTCSEGDWNRYKAQTKLVRKILTKARRNAILASLDDNKKNPRRFWRILNCDLGLSGKKSSGNRNFTRIRNENGEILEGIDACTYMSNYYAHNGVRLASKFTTSWNINDFSPVNKPKKQFHFCFIPMDIVSKLVKEIEISKSSGIPNLSSQLLKDAFSILIPELTHLFNESINTGIFPSTWATGYITPIPKEGDPMDPGNWRPITILPLPSKLLEKAIHTQITIFLDNNNVLDCRQHRFRL